MTKLKKNKQSNPTNAIIFIPIIVTGILIVWSIWAFYNYYLNLKKIPANTAVESYIDNAGLSQVKSKLEQKK